MLRCSTEAFDLKGGCVDGGRSGDQPWRAMAEHAERVAARADFTALVRGLRPRHDLCRRWLGPGRPRGTLAPARRNTGGGRALVQAHRPPLRRAPQPLSGAHRHKPPCIAPGRGREGAGGWQNGTKRGACKSRIVDWHRNGSQHRLAAGSREPKFAPPDRIASQFNIARSVPLRRKGRRLRPPPRPGPPLPQRGGRRRRGLRGWTFASGACSRLRPDSPRRVTCGSAALPGKPVWPAGVMRRMG
jgi:hypothetical protein